MTEDNGDGDSREVAMLFDLTELARDLKFEAPSALTEWLQTERRCWTWADKHEQEYSEVRQRTFERIGKMISEISTMLKKSASREKISQHVVNAFVSGNIPVSSSPAGMFFTDWAAREPDTCVDAARCWFGISTQVSGLGGSDYRVPMKRFRGWVRAAIAADGLPDLRVPLSQTVEDLRRSFEATIDVQKDALKGNLDQSAKVRETIDADHNSFSQFVNDCRGTFSKMEAEFRARMENLSDFYMGKLAVHSAVEYWSKRMVVYNRLSNTWGAVSAVWLAVAAMVLLLTLGSIGAVGDSQHDANDEQTIRSTVIGVREWLGSLTRVGLVVAAFVWPLRIFVRNYLSNAHLATDAGERAIIVQTYLALINDPLLEDDLELKKLMLGPVIESMFRHASDGIVKDDGMPWQPTMFADMVKAASSK